VAQMQLKLASSRSPISRPKILYNRLWRFPFKPRALLGVYWLMPQSDHLKLERGAVTAKREEGGDGGEKGDHGRMCHDDYAKNLWYLRHLRVLSRHRCQREIAVG